MQTKSREILTAIVHGMKREEQSNHVRLAATIALLNSLEFTRSSFENEVRFFKTSQFRVTVIFMQIYLIEFRMKEMLLCKWFAKRRKLSLIMPFAWPLFNVS